MDDQHGGSRFFVRDPFENRIEFTSREVYGSTLTPQMPAKFVKVSPLRVLLPVYNASMFLQGDGALGAILDFRPEPRA